MLQPLIFPLQQPGIMGASPFLVLVLPTDAMAQTYTGPISGGAQFGGAATTAPLKTYGYTPSGGLQTAGGALVAKIKAMVAAGGMAIAGAAVLAKTKAYQAIGAMFVAGTATATFTAAPDDPVPRNRTSMSSRMGMRR